MFRHISRVRANKLASRLLDNFPNFIKYSTRQVNVAEIFTVTFDELWDPVRGKAKLLIEVKFWIMQGCQMFEPGE